MKKSTHLPIYNNYLIQPNGSCSRFVSNSNLYFLIDNVDHFNEYDFYCKDYFTNRSISSNLNRFSYDGIIFSSLVVIRELSDLDVDMDDTNVQEIEIDFQLENESDNYFYCDILFIKEYSLKCIEYSKITFTSNNENDPLFTIFSCIFVSEYDICHVNIQKNKVFYLEHPNILSLNDINKYYLYHLN